MPRYRVPMTLYDPALRYFLAVYETRSINGAARQLFVSASAVSRQISRLEREIGSPLFQRLPSGVAPTHAGRSFSVFASRVIRDAGHLKDEIFEQQNAEATITMAASNGAGHDFLPRVAAQYRELHPTVRFSLHVTEQESVTQMVRDGSADVGVTFNLKIDPGVTIMYSRRAPLVAVVDRGHPLRSETVVALHDLVPYPLALLSPSTTNRRLFDLASASESRTLEPVFVCDNPDALLSFLRGSDAVTLLGKITVLRNIADGDVITIQLKEQELGQRNLQVQTKAGRNLPIALTTFLEFLIFALEASDI